MTISMCLKAVSEGDSDLRLKDGRSLHHVKIVGAIREKMDNSTNVLYTIEDGTGLLDVKQWADVNDCSFLLEQREKLTETKYVSVIGSVKDFDGKKTVVADSIREVEPNELTHHMLEVVYIAETYKRGQTAGPSGIGFGTNVPSFGVPLQQQTSNTNGGGLKDDVIAYMKDHPDDNNGGNGANYHLMCQSLNKYDASDIRRMLDELSAEGLIYSTIDENNFAPAFG